MGCDVRVYDPRGLPLKDDLDACVDGKATSSTEDHPKVKELREVVMWSEAQFWCSPEQHGTLTGIMKTLLDHIPLGTGSVRPTQGKVLAVAQVCLSRCTRILGTDQLTRRLPPHRSAVAHSLLMP